MIELPSQTPGLVEAMVDRRHALAMLGAMPLSTIASRAGSAAPNNSRYGVVQIHPDVLYNAVERMPFVTQGVGQKLYILMSQTCGFCKALWRVRNRSVAGARPVQVRWIPETYSLNDPDQVAQVQATRSMRDLDAFMNNRLSAPDWSEDPRRSEAYAKADLDLKKAETVLGENGFAIGTPAYVWKKKGLVYYAAGYTPMLYAAILQEVGEG